MFQIMVFIQNCSGALIITFRNSITVKIYCQNIGKFIYFDMIFTHDQNMFDCISVNVSMYIYDTVFRINLQ